MDDIEELWKLLSTFSLNKIKQSKTKKYWKSIPVNCQRNAREKNHNILETMDDLGSKIK